MQRATTAQPSRSTPSMTPDTAHPPMAQNSARAAPGGGSRAARRLADNPGILRLALAATLLLPVVLLYTRAAGDVLLSLVAIMFLARTCILRDWSWLTTPHARLAVAFWLWLMACTIIAGTHRAIGEALAVSRLFLFAAALEGWVLLRSDRRRQLWIVVLAVAVWIVTETWQQYALGTNIFGYPRWGSGVLTGPFAGPRAGGTLQMLFLPAFLPPVLLGFDKPGVVPRLAGLLLLFVVMLTEALIGQRMPMVLLLFSLCLTGLVVRRFRWPVGIALAVLAATIAAAPILSPVTYATLVVTFLHRMQDFWDTPYALLYQRAIVMVQAHPWLGLGFDGFRDNCNDPVYFKAIAWLPVTRIGSPDGCSIHPHNYWLQIATSTGLPGLLLFTALCLAWLVRIGKGVFAGGRPIQVALFVTACTALWPIASTTALFTVPNAGWFFLTIGWGLAEQRGGQTRHAGFTVPLKGC
jgi:O-antigen ligase